MTLRRPLRTLASSVLLACAVCSPLLAPTAQAMVVSAERIGQTIEFAAAPDHILAGPKNSIIIAYGRGAQTEIVLYGFENANADEKFSTSLPFLADDLAFDRQTNRVVAAGQDGDRTVIAAISVETGEIKTGSLAPARRPILAIDAESRIYMADGATNMIHLVFEQKVDGDRLEFGFMSIRYDSKGGIDDFNVSPDGEFLFVSDYSRPQLVVMRRRGFVSDEISLDRAAKDSRAPVPVKMLRDSQEKALGTATSLLLAEYNSETLTAVTFEPLLRSLSVAASGSIALPIEPGSVVQKDRSTGFPMSPTVIAANPDQTSIVVGNEFSTRVLFLTKQGRVLERTGSAELSTPPKALLVSDSGQHVLVVHEGSKTATVLNLLATSSNEVGGTSAAILQPDGNTDIREMQRLLGQLGFPVGTVDGVVGPLTSSSIRAVEASRKIDLNVADLPSTIETLRGLVNDTENTKTAY